MVVASIAMLAGVVLVVAAPWIASEGRASKLSQVFLLRLLWSFSTNVWWVRYLGASSVLLGMWMAATA